MRDKIKEIRDRLIKQRQKDSADYHRGYCDAVLDFCTELLKEVPNG